MIIKKIAKIDSQNNQKTRLPVSEVNVGSLSGPKNHATFQPTRSRSCLNILFLSGKVRWSVGWLDNLGIRLNSAQTGVECVLSWE